MLQTSGRLQISAAALKLGVTEMTIRRDLRVLADRKIVLLVRGGAVLHPARYEPEKSTLMLTPEKFQLAERLYEEIMPAKRIFIGAGFTVLAFAKLLAERKSPVTVITHSLPVAAALFQTRHKVIITGGELRQTSMDLIGSLTENNMAEYHVDWLISGCDAASGVRGFFTYDAALQQLERKEIELAEKVAIITDSSKFRQRGGVCFAVPEVVSLVVTDTGIPSSDEEGLNSAGVKVALA